MSPVSYQQSAYLYRPSLRSRATAVSLALGVVLLVVVMLLKLGGISPRLPEVDRKPVTFRLLPESRSTPKRARTVSKRASSGQTSAVTKPAPAAATVPPVPTNAPMPMVIVSREVFAASDISKMPSHRGEPAGAGAQGTGDGTDSDSTDGPGEGPGGERLYNAEWYRKPTHAELAYYLPTGNLQAGWGMVACQTVAKYRVENCRELGDSPPGSGLARAVRQAAWQFLVRPPRIGGRSVVGAWVRIRIEFTPGSVK